MAEPPRIAEPRHSPTSYDIDMVTPTPTPMPHTPARPALPFSGQTGSQRLSRPMDAVEPSSSGSQPRLAEASIPPVPSSREHDVIIVPPGNMFEDPRSAGYSATAGGAPHAVQPGPGTAAPAAKPKVKNRYRKKATPDAAPAPDAARRTASAPARATAPAAPKPATRPVAPRKRRTVWLILLMIVLGGGAMAAAYFWPDLQDLIDQLRDRFTD